jgi:hypothetical protein
MSRIGKIAKRNQGPGFGWRFVELSKYQGSSSQIRPNQGKSSHSETIFFAGIKPQRLISLGKSGGGLYIGCKLKNLTKQEQFVLCLILLLVLTGWAVKVYRTGHAPASPLTQQSP